MSDIWLEGKIFVIRTVLEHACIKFCNARLAARSSLFSLKSSSFSSNSCSDSESSESQSAMDGECCSCKQFFDDGDCWFPGWIVCSSDVVGSSSSSIDDMLQRRTRRRFMIIVVRSSVEDKDKMYLEWTMKSETDSKGKVIMKKKAGDISKEELNTCWRIYGMQYVCIISFFRFDFSRSTHIRYHLSCIDYRVQVRKRGEKRIHSFDCRYCHVIETDKKFKHARCTIYLD